eukprot:15326696-Ditylum_brightwellii.AAC.4
MLGDDKEKRSKERSNRKGKNDKEHAVIEVDNNNGYSTGEESEDDKEEVYDNTQLDTFDDGTIMI